MPKIVKDYLFSTFNSILQKIGFEKSDAEILSQIFTENTLVGVLSHGVNRFAEFIELVKSKHINPKAIPQKKNSFNSLEQWDAKFGAGPLNALKMSNRAIELANEFGIGCVALKNSNHWMRPGYYAWEAAEKGFIFICWTNTIPIMPPWGAKEARTGNNPIVFGVPRKEGNIVLDIALSQFSYGKLANYKRENKELPYFGGYDENGNLSKDAAQIYKTQRTLPIGLWKGSGLSLLLDMIATILSGGNSTFNLSKTDVDSGMSQIFIAIDPNKLASKEIIEMKVNEILDYYLTAEKSDEDKISYPGERIIASKEINLKFGVEVDDTIWAKIIEIKEQYEKN
ncbi:MAG: 3-dehydro-L-gulonate 2-dehydrogenase [Ignavibacteriae bacterium]|nr:3-dehydro-L-gulonate 2-dehydrogenase [Ignavibacteriota bacterium]